MKRISAYQATDGTMFNDKKECKAHEAALLLIKRISTIAAKMEDDPKYFNDDANCNCIIDSVQLTGFIMENGAEIVAALTGKAEKPAETPEA